MASLTDEQLIEELKSFGEDVRVKIPLKQVKRDVLIKKLNHLRIKNKNSDTLSRKNSSYASLGAFSSDESDTGTGSIVKDNKDSYVLRRRSKNKSFSSQSHPSISNADDHLTKPSSRTASKYLTPRSQIPSSNVIKRQSDLRDTESHESKKSPRNWGGLFSFGFTKASKPSVIANQPKTAGRDKVYCNESKSRDDFDSSDSDIDLNSTYEVENRSMNTTFTIEDSNEPLFGRSLRNRSFNNTATKSFSPRTSTPSSQKAEKNTALKKGTILTKALSNAESNAEQNIKSINISSRQKGRSTTYKETPHTSRILLLLAALFFIVLTCGYLYIRQPQRSLPNSYSETNFLICPDERSQSVAVTCEGEDDSDCLKTCYKREQVKTAYQIIVRDLFDELSKRKGDLTCGYEDTGNMTMAELRRFIKDKNTSGDTVSDIQRVILDLLIHNEQWQLRVLTGEYTTARSLTDARYLESSVAMQDVVCRVRLAVYRLIGHVIVWMCIAAVAVALAWIILYAFRRRSNRIDEQRETVYSMVEDIIDILKTNSETPGREPYLAIQHVRDVIIPPARRRALNASWDKAVKFIEEHESRIRLETQTIQGEDFVVWRWLQTFPSPGKVWQGQACGERELTFNTLAYSPTQCLKIRNMFDSKAESEGGEWEVRVRDAILEKSSDCHVLHMFVDRNSREGCVYVKCTSPEEAGKVYRALHGWWFDGKLVTVKYLRLEHYHERFPDSVLATQPLAPTTGEKFSLSRPYHSSSLEVT